MISTIEIKKVPLKGTVDRDKKLLDLKKKIAWGCCSNLLCPPLIAIGPLRFAKGESEEEKQIKRLEHSKKLKEREDERIRREPELIRELDRIIERVKSTRVEYTSGINYAVVTEAYKTVRFTCERCGNQNQLNTISDPRSGDLICNGSDGFGCGFVVQSHHVDLGAAKRNFEGVEEKNHYGPTPNHLMSDAWNMSTSMCTTSFTGHDDSGFKKLSHAARTVEMDLSNIGCDDRRTREGYKSKQKRQAFELMEHLADNLNIHRSVVVRAEEEFSKYRDVRESLQQYEGVVAACLALAYQELSALEDVDKKAPVFRSQFRPQQESKAAMSDAAVLCLREVPIGRWGIDQVSPCPSAPLLLPLTTCRLVPGSVRWRWRAAQCILSRRRPSSTLPPPPPSCSPRQRERPSPQPLLPPRRRRPSGRRGSTPRLQLGSWAARR